MASFKIYTRTGCCLCEEMHEALIQAGIVPSDIELIDIDQRPELVALYGARIPVLEKSGLELAAGRLSGQSMSALRQ